MTLPGGRKLLDRDTFRESVLERDGGRCVLCGAEGQDAHHVFERRLFPDGGYYLDNGATVCGPCHLACETTEIPVEDVLRAANIKRAVHPPQLYPDHAYDKWGNPILADGRRAAGELLHDESVRRVLDRGGFLELFTQYVKYPRTWHAPQSPGATPDDRVLRDLSAFEGRRVVITLKMDGENASLYPDHLHARSVDGPTHPSRDWLKSFHARIRADIPEGWRVCGENLYARHAIAYEALPSWFLGFSVWNTDNVCLSWDETLEWFQLVGCSAGLRVIPVPVLHDGPFDARTFLSLAEGAVADGHEGVVMRVADAFGYGDFSRLVCKYVRSRHAATTHDWKHRPLTSNGLASNAVT